MSYIPHTPFSSDRPRRTATVPAASTLEACANARRRVLLSVLATASEPRTDAALATRVAAREEGKPAAAVTDEERDSVAATLHHRHLPKLTDLGVVERTDEGTVLADDAPEFDARGLLDVPDASDTAGASEADALFDALASDERRVVLAVLAEAATEEAMTVECLVEALADDDAPGPDVELSAADAPRAEIELHHRHLPKLADCELVSWDREAGTVAFEGHPLLRESWVDSAAASESTTGPLPGGE